MPEKAVDVWEDAFREAGRDVLSRKCDPWLAENVQILSGSQTIADIGCGTGRHAALLTSVAAEVILVDRSRTALELATRAAGDGARVRTVEGDLGENWTGHYEADAAVCIDVISTLEKPAAGFANLFAAVVGGGLVLATVNTPDDAIFQAPSQDAESSFAFRAYDETQLRCLARDAGFRIRSLDRYVWQEEAHHHRPYPHEHRGIGFVMERPRGA